MATPFDDLAKNIFDVMLDGLGTLEREFVVSSLTPQRADLRFVPDPAHTTERRALGLLGRMTDAPCLLEPFHEAPSYAELIACLRKLLNAQHAGELDATQAVSIAWVICGGRPDGAMKTLRAKRMRQWPDGFYEALPSVPLVLVVLPELPETDDTLALRLMSKGSTWGRALDDLDARRSELARGAELYELVVETFVAARDRGAPLETSMIDLSRARKLIADTRNEGRVEGRAEGLRLAIETACELLGVTLSDAQRDWLASASVDELDARLASLRHTRAWSDATS